MAMKTAQVLGTVAAVGGRRRIDIVDERAVEVGFGTKVPRHFLVALDVLTLALAFVSAYLLALSIRDVTLHARWFQAFVPLLVPDSAGGFRPMAEASWVLFVTTPVVIVCMQALGGYRPFCSQSRSRLVLSSLLAPLMGLGAIAIVLFALRIPSWSRVFIFLFTGFGAVLLSGSRLAIRAYHMRRIRAGVYARNVVLVGPSRSVDAIADYLRSATTPEVYQIVGCLQIAAQAAENMPATLAPVGTVEGFGDILVHRPIHEVIAIQGGDGGGWIRHLVETCDYFRVTLRIVPEALLFGNLKDLQLLYHADPLRLPEVVLRPNDFASDALFLKRMIDIIVSGFLLLVLSPLFAVIALANLALLVQMAR